MHKGDDIWREYCAHFEKDFSTQLEESESILKKHFKRWTRTKTAKYICSGDTIFLEDIPVTTYEDYPILTTFGRRVENILKKDPRPKGQTWWQYYHSHRNKIGGMLKGWLPYEYGICAKTTGSLGKSRWYAHGVPFVTNMRREAVTGIALGCSEEWGTTKLGYGDTVLNMGVPIPYMVGHAMRLLDEEFNCFPPIEITDEISDMTKKLNLIIRSIKKGQNIDVATAMASTFYMFSQAVVAPEELYKEYYRSMRPGLKKIILYILYLKEKLSHRKTEKAGDVLSVKGLCTAGLDAKLYSEYLKEQYGTYPLNMYGSTEYGIVMHGMPDRRSDLMPSLRCMYFEFLDEEGELYRIEELKKNEVYEVLGTPYGSMLFRYSVGDLLRVIDKRDDGMPIFTFEGRKENLLTIRDYMTISESMAFKLMEEAELKNTDRWLITKKFDPVEKILVLMEKDWTFDEAAAEERVFNALNRLSPEFRDMIEDFGIDTPKQIIEVRYLKKGAFMRYSLKKKEEGVPIGQYKTPKVLLPEKSEEIELITSV